MALIVIGVLLELVSAMGGIEGYLITDPSWRLGLAGIGILLILSGLVFIRKQTNPQPSDEVRSQEQVISPSNESEKVPVPSQELDLVTRVAQEMIYLAKSYMEGVREALAPNDLQEFLDKKRQPFVDRQLEWWEKAIATGEGPRGISLTFMDKEKATRLFKLSSQLGDIAKESKQVTDLVVLSEAIFSQSAGFHSLNDHGQREYRQTHLRDHIRKIIDLNTAARECRTSPIVREMLTR